MSSPASPPPSLSFIFLLPVLLLIIALPILFITIYFTLFDMSDFTEIILILSLSVLFLVTFLGGLAFFWNL
ncbi:hypothetical protein BGX38DRAFT_1165560 [Terfezia claveryi]|nr:hypothetical protein BGX38DRAFT_1165560 [Terfezia claveryi]